MVIRPWFCGLRFATSASTLSALSVWPIDLSRLMYWSASLALPGSASQRLAAAAVCLSEIVPVDPVRSESLLIVWHPASGSAASTRRLAPAISCRRERLPAPRVDLIMNNSRKQTPINVAGIIFADLPQQTINYKPHSRPSRKPVHFLQHWFSLRRHFP